MQELKEVLQSVQNSAWQSKCSAFGSGSSGVVAIAAATATPVPPLPPIATNSEFSNDIELPNQSV